MSDNVPSSLAQLLDLIVARMAEKLGNAVRVEPHDGRFDAEEIRRCAAFAPAVFVSCLGTVPEQNPRVGKNLNPRVQWGAWILTKDQAIPAQIGRMKVALNLGEVLMRLVAVETWDAWNTSAAMNLSLANLYNGKKTDAAGVALWVLSWDQRVELNLSTPIDQLDAFTQLDSTIVATTPSTTPTAERQVLAEDLIALEQE
jgi:hypothetical protein